MSVTVISGRRRTSSVLTCTSCCFFVAVVTFMTVVLTKVVQKQVFLDLPPYAGLESAHISTISISTHPPDCQDLIEFVSLLLQSNALITFFFFFSSVASGFFDSDRQICCWDLKRNLCLDKHISRKSPQLKTSPHRPRMRSSPATVCVPKSFQSAT